MTLLVGWFRRTDSQSPKTKEKCNSGGRNILTIVIVSSQIAKEFARRMDGGGKRNEV